MIVRMCLEGLLHVTPCGCQNLLNCHAEDGCVPLSWSLDSNETDYRLYNDILYSVIISITVIVVAIPEGLPLAVTISLSVSSSQMQKLNNLVRKLASSETMGGATHICSDKTGTLTQNKMTTMACNTLQTVHEAGALVRTELANEVKAASDGCIVNGGDSAWKLLLEGVMWNSSAFLEKNDGSDPANTDPYVLRGNVTEQGLIKFFMWALGAGAALAKKKELTEDNVLTLISFTSARKRATIVVRRPEAEGTDSEVRVYCKGAPDMVFDDTYRVIEASGELKNINDEGDCPDCLLQQGEFTGARVSYRHQFDRTIKRFAKQAYRTLLITYKDMSMKEYLELKAANNNFEKEADRYVLERNLVAIGLFGLQDPLRDTIKSSIEKCKTAGITTIMCTGDNTDTAKAISINAGIIEPEQADRPYAVMTGKEFRETVGGLTKVPSDEKEGEMVDAVADMRKFRDVLNNLKVLGRSSPEDKYILVTGLQAMQKVVAVTGDGTNDAPALTKADVGFAMGITGTDVAKGACDIILLDDNFSSIVVALKYGRNV